MQKKIRFLSSVALLSTVLSITSCATVPLKPGAEKVNVTTDTNAVIPCQYVGKIITRTTAPYALAATKINTNEINAIKNAALTLNANVVVLSTALSSQVGHGAPSAANNNQNLRILIGEAYACP